MDLGPFSSSFLMISQATDMLEQQFQQFWNLLSQTILMISITPIFLAIFFDKVFLIVWEMVHAKFPNFLTIRITLRSGLVSRFQICWKFCSSMSVAWEIMKKTPKTASFCSDALFWQFWHDFSGYRHTRAKISTVLESSHQGHSNDTHIAYIHGKKYFGDQRGDPMIFQHVQMLERP